MYKSPLAASIALGALLVSCQTVTEELPSRPNPVILPVPVVVVPVPVPVPNNPAPTPPGNPAPPPSNPPNNPNPPPPGDGNGDVPSNTNPVAKLTAKLYFAECQGQIVDPSEMRVGCRCHLDVTPTDAANKHTQIRGSLNWTFSNQGIVDVGGTLPFNPTLLGKAPGTVDAYADGDGVRSNTVSCHFR